MIEDSNESKLGGYCCNQFVSIYNSVSFIDCMSIKWCECEYIISGGGWIDELGLGIYAYLKAWGYVYNGDESFKIGK